MRMGIRAKLVGTLLLAGLLPLALALAAILVGFVELRIASKGRMYRALAQERAAHLSSILSSHVELIQMINGLPGCTDLIEQANEVPPLTQAQIDQIEQNWPALRENQGLLAKILDNPVSYRWRAVQEHDRRFTEVMLTDVTGRLIAASNKTSDYFQADEQWWQDCYAGGKGKVTISDIVFDESAISPAGPTGTLVVNICVPIFSNGKQRKVIGIVKTSIDARWLQAQLDVPHGSDEIPHNIWLVAESGRAVSGGGSRPPVENLPLHLARALKAQSHGWAIEEQIPGHELIGFAAMERGNHIDVQEKWYVVVATSRSGVLAAVHRLVGTILILGLGIIALCFVGGLFIAQRYIVRPVRALEDAVGQIKSGQRDFRLSESRGRGTLFNQDELGRLAHDFNLMAQELQSNLQRLEEADAIKRQFIDLASHELRTPVTYILGAAQLGQRHNGNVSSDILARIATKAQRLNRIVENMFKLLANDRFDGRLRTAPVDLKSVVEAVCQEHDPFLLERRQQWDLDLPDGLPPVQGDPDKIRDIVANLVSNAIRFSPDGGIIAVHLVQEQDELALAITDSGPGIAQGDLPNLFQPFFTGAGLKQSSGDFQFMSRGMGLGLSVVKRFVELHGGRVLVDTSSGGTTIRVMLPAAEVAQPGELAAAQH